MSQAPERGMSPILRFFARMAVRIDNSIGWDKLPTPLALPVLILLRSVYRWRNLYDTSTLPSVSTDEPVVRDSRHLTARTADGTFNDLQNPAMGGPGLRFGRNIPLDQAYPEAEPRILEPNPRTVSRELLTREQFIPATTINVLAAAWLQFMIRDWFSHGKGDIERPWRLPLSDDDTWPQNPMIIPRTLADPTRPAGDTSGPPTYINTESPWWDGSHLYGTTKEMQATVRSGENGKLRLDPGAMIPRPLLEQASHEPGFWSGLAMLHTVFAREHNAICDHLKSAYPSWSDDDIFDKARLVNAALLAKIHTVEWTPAIISHPTTQFALRANWWGLLQERLTRAIGRKGIDLLTGIPGSPTDHHAAPYSLTEEFTAVYRMHPLIPDDYEFRAVNDGRAVSQQTFSEISGLNTPGLLDQISLADQFYSFGIAHPGAVTLHNFPRFLQELHRPDGKVMDLAATDILRIREVGVPRYNRFRRLMHMKPARSFDQLTDNPIWADEMRRVYGDVEQVDLMVGMFAEPKPFRFGFSDTAFRIFVLMASRRLKSDRFFTVDYTPRVYTPEGLKWIDDTDMSTILRRHMPELGTALRGVKNAFAPWKNLTA